MIQINLTEEQVETLIGYLGEYLDDNDNEDLQDIYNKLIEVVI